MTTNSPRNPTWRDHLGKHAPDTLESIIELQETVTKDGALSLKTKTLMMLLCDALMAHPDGVTNLARRARALGANDHEIAETIAVGFLMGGMPALVTGANAFKEQ